MKTVTKSTRGNDMANKVCMYCGRIFGKVDGEYDSHGVCSSAECRKKLADQMK